VILPTRTRNIVGTTLWIVGGIKTKIGIVNHVDEEARSKFEGDLLGGTYMPGAFLRTRRYAKTLGIARCGGLEEGDIERCVRIVFSRAVAPRAESIAKVNGTGMPEDSIKIDETHGVSQAIKRVVPQ